MLLYAVIIFAVAAVGGLVLATNVLGGNSLPGHYLFSTHYSVPQAWSSSSSPLWVAPVE